MSFGITKNGFIRKKFPDILDEMKIEAKNKFGDEIDLSDFSPLLPMLELMSFSLAKQWEALENVYYANFLLTSSGVNLDRVVSLGLVSRKNALPATTTLEFSGKPNIAIPKGTLSSTTNDIIIFKTKKDAITSKIGKIKVEAVCTIAGKTGNVKENEIVKIKTPIMGIDKVTNIIQATGGREKENDIELINRFKASGIAKGGTVAGITAAVESLNGVISCKVLENTENIVNKDGIPYRSIEVIVLGGKDEDIAQAILSNKTAGIISYGLSSVRIADSLGNTHIIKFSRPKQIEIDILYTIQINPNFKESIKKEIKQKAYKHVAEYKAGEDLKLWKLIAILPEYKGIEHITVQAKRKSDANYSIQELKTVSREILYCPFQNIKVVKTE